MTTFESDHGDPGGPWNLSKKLRFLDFLMFRGRVGVFDPLNMVWGVCNLARSFGNSILIVFLFLKTSNGPLEPKLGHFQGNHSDPIDLGSLGHFFSNEKSTGYEASVDFAQENKICKKLKNFLLLPANGKCLGSKILTTWVWASLGHFFQKFWISSKLFCWISPREKLVWKTIGCFRLYDLLDHVVVQF